MKRLLLGLMLLMTAGAASAEWTLVNVGDDRFVFVDIATIRRNGNFVKMWRLVNFNTTQTAAGFSFLSSKSLLEADCKEERVRDLAYSWFSGKMGSGNVVHTDSASTMKWIPIEPESIGETLWKIACGKK